MLSPSSLLLLVALAAPQPTPGQQKLANAQWLGEELPLPLVVRTPEDLRLKAAAEKQYLVFNLLAGGKLAWDAHDWGTAASKWETLLRTPEVPPELAATVKPFADEARRRAGGEAAAIPAPPPEKIAEPARAMEPVKKAAAAATAGLTLTGTVSGGGSLGPGGTVVMLKRLDGTAPAPKAKKALVLQQGKKFVPRVIAVPVGTEVEFKNEDAISHNVFSLTRPNDFDLGLYPKGESKSQPFAHAGPVQVLCNIHSSMVGWVYVVDSAWFAQADASGAFSIKGVPAGEYVLEAWNEGASKPTKQRVKVAEDAAPVAVTVGGDVRPAAFMPDKYGKPRQVQLGY